MHDPDNEFSLDLFKDYRNVEIITTPSQAFAAHGDYVYVSSLGYVMNFTKKEILVQKPIKLIDLYRDLLSEMNNNVDLITEPTPMVAVTQQLFDLADGWSFESDTSRKNILEAGWTEGDDEWACIMPLGCWGKIINFSYSWATPQYRSWTQFENIGTLTGADSGNVSEAIKVMGTPDELFLNIDGERKWASVNSFTGLLTFPGLIAVPVNWK